MNIKIELQPFSTPNFVLEKQKPGLKQDGFKEGRVYDLNEIEKDELEKMCKDFRDEIMRKAGYEK
jgi:hypothetical protein